MTEGVLLVDKPAGWTSFDVVNKIRHVVAEADGKKPRNVKVGHTGTLDPFATGLLVILIGKSYTKRAQELSGDDKTYSFTVRMGQRSTTGDPEGEISDCHCRSVNLTKEDLRASLKGWVGIVNQRPPAYSAIKLNGKRAYELARAGQSVEIPERRVEIKAIELDSFDPPYFSATTTVSKGTYIRTLAEDICRRLDCCGYVTELRRTAAGRFRIEDAVAISKDSSIDDFKERLFSLD